MTDAWPQLNYSDWQPTCDTLHAHSQVVGKIAAALAPPEPQLQHAALRLTARGFETLPLPVAGHTAAVSVGLDLRGHEAFAERSDGRRARVALGPNRSVGAVTRQLLESLSSLGADVEIDPAPQEVWWTVPLDQDEEHSTYDTAAVERYFDCATRAALALAAVRAPYRGRATPVNYWWGSFDLAVNLFSGEPAEPPSPDFIMRNAMDSQEIALGWWPGDPRYKRAAFYAYAHPAPPGFGQGQLLESEGGWNDALGEYVLDQDSVRAHSDPHAGALEFLRAAFRHACHTCSWEPGLLASVEGNPPPLR